MRAVLDASYLLEFIQNPELENFQWVLESELLSPCLLRYEYNNILLHKAKNDRKIIDQFRNAIYALSIVFIDVVGQEEYVASLAINHQLSFYDASHLAIAKEKCIPLANL
jgi:predicted nucleic acid-binding protein